MKQFVIGVLDTPQKKQEAEAILKELGYESNERWNINFREDEDATFIATYIYGDYQYHNHDCEQPPITLEELKAMKNPYPKVMWVWDDHEKSAIKHEVIMEIEHEGIKGYVNRDGNDFYVYRNAKDIEEPIKMKTPMQEFFEFMHQNQYFIGNDLLAKYKELLEKEKEVMCDFANTYADEVMGGMTKRAKEYFNQTFNTKQK